MFYSYGPTVLAVDQEGHAYLKKVRCLSISFHSSSEAMYLAIMDWNEQD